eukprot:TRINITY_DN68014_c2_g1_i1.p1 TRINITY_DN68014_c2_g1~~TRINITY_DN68014_c2_g1_i1.p1  ORF type:complete len:213 (-),score=25.53 TRINITY_DN68014_c2_g1_i1:463-1101(-)
MRLKVPAYVAFMVALALVTLIMMINYTLQQNSKLSNEITELQKENSKLRDQKDDQVKLRETIVRQAKNSEAQWEKKLEQEQKRKVSAELFDGHAINNTDAEADYDHLVKLTITFNDKQITDVFEIDRGCWVDLDITAAQAKTLGLRKAVTEQRDLETGENVDVTCYEEDLQVMAVGYEPHESASCCVSVLPNIGVVCSELVTKLRRTNPESA